MDEKVNNQNSQKSDFKISPTLILVSIGILLLITAILLYPDARQKMDQERLLSTRQALPTPTNSSPTPDPVPSPTPTAIPVDQSVLTYPSQFGILILALQEGTDSHLFAYQPFLEDTNGDGFNGLPLTRLTSGPYQDTSPDISPDGRYIAFSSNRGGQWDIYILDLQTGDLEQFTDTAAYDGHPSWSPDGAWLAYESYQLDNLEILIQDRARTTGAISLTRDPAADFSPDWSPQGRQISFISNRSGQLAVWYADLDLPEEDKAVKITNLTGSSIKHSSWSQDGRYLTWAITSSAGEHTLVTWDSQNPEHDPVYSGSGDWPLWAGSTNLLYSIMEQPDGTYLGGYPGLAENAEITLPAIKLPGRVEGLSWVDGSTFSWMEELSDSPAPTPIWSSLEGSPDKSDLKRLGNVTAPNPVLLEDAATNFSGLRQAVIHAAGWDFLSTLENAYVPIDQALSPGIDLDWLRTGRGITISDIPRKAGWLKLVREDYDGRTYWRVFIKANDQGGRQGRPLQSLSWDLSARYSGSNSDYENGGAYSKEISPGYWVDFTSLAEAYGWQRFPAETYWQYAEPASRYQYFAFTQGLSLKKALEQLYSEAEINDFQDSAQP